MKKLLLRTGVLCIGLVWALSAGNNFLNGTEPHFSERERHSLKLARKWMHNKNKSFRGEDGSVVFLHGATMPSVIAAPLRITDIQLQAGEKIREVQMGDTVRWRVTPSVSGTPPNEVSHVIIKPTDVGLKTTLVIMTDRRTYHLNLISSRHRYMPIVGFEYKDEIDAKWAQYQNYMKQQQNAKKLPMAGSRSRNIDNLDFSYTITGDYYWKPTRVYNDGVKTYIQMPKTMKFKESPVLMVTDKGTEKLVNYRLKNDKYIVDKLFDQAILIMGVGYQQEKVIITHTKKGYSTRAKEILSIMSTRGDE